MSLRTIGRPILTADLPKAVSQIITPTSGIILRGVQAGIILYNDPAFTTIEARIYSDSAGSAKMLIATSTNTWSKAEILLVDDHALKFVGFTFNYVPLQASVPYHFVIYPNGYTGTDSSHIAFRISYPDPQYQTGLTLDAAHGDNHHLELNVIGAEQ